MLDKRIRQLRLERGINQKELGDAVGVSKQSVSNWENGNIMPSIDLLIRLADFFGVSTDHLLGRTDRRSVDVEGLTDLQITHLQLIVDDLRGRSQTASAAI